MNHRFSLRYIIAATPLWVLAGVLLSVNGSRADEPSPKHRRMENRFLFVIDTSSAMKARTNGIQEAVNGLLESDMKGELRKGDTIGLWTYNDKLGTDFPMEIWSEEKKESIFLEVREHMRHLHYEKRSHLDKTFPEIMHVVENSERLTVILIFDGADSIKGTLFDKDINALHKRYAPEFRTAHEPVVTILAARNGAIFDYTINYPGTVVVPHTADPLPPPETNAPTPLVANASPTIITPTPPGYIVREPAPEDASQPPHTNVQIILSGSDFAHKPSAPPPIVSSELAVATPTPIPPPAVVSNVQTPAEAAPVAVQSAQTIAASSEQPRSTPPSPVVTSPANAASPSPNSPAPMAPAVAVAPAGQLSAMFIIAFSLLTIAVVLVLLLVRRWRTPPQSLITESINRTR
jgi:hypothetical protein